MGLVATQSDLHHQERERFLAEWRSRYLSSETIDPMQAVPHRSCALPRMLWVRKASSSFSGGVRRFIVSPSAPELVLRCLKGAGRSHRQAPGCRWIWTYQIQTWGVRSTA